MLSFRFTKAVLGNKKKENQKKRSEKTKFKKNMNFVHRTSSEEEKEIRFSRQNNDEFYNRNKKQQQAKDVSKKTCFICQQIGHVGRKCPNLKHVDVEKNTKKSEIEVTKFESK
ncbi:putative transcription factor interactor and regulator CCHC(Zn) family [Helianthus anomalus]